MRDQVLILKDGWWWCVVDGRAFGPWKARKYAEAGLAIERARAARRQHQEAINRAHDGESPFCLLTKREDGTLVAVLPNHYGTPSCRGAVMVKLLRRAYRDLHNDGAHFKLVRDIEKYLKEAL